MSLQCSCGCGQPLPEKEAGINEFGELETMRKDCISIGRGDESPADLLGRVWDEFLCGLSDDDRDTLKGT